MQEHFSMLQSQSVESTCLCIQSTMLCIYKSFSMIVISDDRCLHTCTQCSSVYIGVFHQHWTMN